MLIGCRHSKLGSTVLNTRIFRWKCSQRSSHVFRTRVQFMWCKRGSKACSQHTDWIELTERVDPVIRRTHGDSTARPRNYLLLTVVLGVDLGYVTRNSYTKKPKALIGDAQSPASRHFGLLRADWLQTQWTRSHSFGHVLRDCSHSSLRTPIPKLWTFLLKHACSE